MRFNHQCLLCFLYKFWLRFVIRARIGSRCALKGLPLIRVGGCRSRIEIGDHFTAISRIVDNSIGVPHKVVIRTISDGARIEIGNHVGISGCVISAANAISIGDRTLVGSGALIFDSDIHPLDSIARQRDDGNKGNSKPIRIEEDVFIGARAIILKGTHIGARSIVAAGSVVFGLDIPPDSLAKGNPAVICERKK